MKIHKKIKKQIMIYERILVILIIILFIIVLFFCSSIMINDFQQTKENNDFTENLIENSFEINSETQEVVKIDWNYLKSVNEDVIAWIEIEGTNINYPILKEKDTYYLHHTFDRKYNSNGSIFTTNSYPFVDAETIVYGHNMRNGSMFSKLGKYLNEDFLYSHNRFKIYTPNCNYEATVFSAYSIGVEVENNNIKLLDFDDRVDYYKKASKIHIEFNDNINKIVKLSTCSYINAKTRPTDQRYYIIASIFPIE